MAGHMAAIAASLNPGGWEKDPSPEGNLKNFDDYIDKFDRWLDVCDMQLTIRQKWGLLIATGGTHMKDLVIHQAAVEVRQIPEVQAVQAVQGVVGVPAGPQGNPPAVQAVQAVAEVIGQPAVNPTPWEAGLVLIRAAISKYANQITARKKLFSEMPHTDYSDWRKWTQELLEQAKRCIWTNYGPEQAALDALLYQCPDEGWRNKIIGGKMDFHEAVDWGPPRSTQRLKGKR